MIAFVWWKLCESSMPICIICSLLFCIITLDITVTQTYLLVLLGFFFKSLFLPRAFQLSGSLQWTGEGSDCIVFSARFIPWNHFSREVGSFSTFTKKPIAFCHIYLEMKCTFWNGILGILPELKVRLEGSTIEIIIDYNGIFFITITCTSYLRIYHVRCIL